MATSLKSKNQYHTRSISFPCKSHPKIQKIEEELNKIRPFDSSLSASSAAKTICNNLSGLKTLHECLVDLLKLPLTQQALAKHHQHVESINLLLDGSLRILDVAGITMDTISQTKEHVKDLQSALRRRKGDLCIENSIARYVAFRRKVKKDTKMLIAAVQQMDNEIRVLEVSDFQEDHFSAVIRVLKEVTLTSISVYECVLTCLLLPLAKLKSSGWSSISKMMQNKINLTGKARSDETNEFECVDSVLSSLCKYGSKDAEQNQSALSRLESLEVQLEGIEDKLQCVFRCLISSRTTLLNIISC